MFYITEWLVWGCGAGAKTSPAPVWRYFRYASSSTIANRISDTTKPSTFPYESIVAVVAIALILDSLIQSLYFLSPERTLPAECHGRVGLPLLPGVMVVQICLTCSSRLQEGRQPGDDAGHDENRYRPFANTEARKMGLTLSFQDMWKKRTIETTK